MMESFKIDAWEAGTKINFEFMGNLNPIYYEGYSVQQGVEFIRTKNRKFRVIANPSYQHGRERKWISRRFPMIKIEPTRLINGNENPLTPYNLRAKLDGAELPSGRIQCIVEGQYLQHLAEGNITQAVVDNSLPIILSFFHVDNRGRKKCNVHDRKYVLWIRMDLKMFLIIAQEYDFKKFKLPFWCRECDDEIKTQTTLVYRDCAYSHEKETLRMRY
ncbi:hypothetical protein UCDDA912_g10710 [Diaporthe ampelina]|uniref:Uncharacterized protein n=1 Tax=Diaporthe ampelina TaxID=1214573 RepID=A0A0G2F555_9PEZI|nr:hypothetical protein UCDDA912_g10710 [Diaporthe ampelina]